MSHNFVIYQMLSTLCGLRNCCAKEKGLFCLICLLRDTFSGFYSWLTINSKFSAPSNKWIDIVPARTFRWHFFNASFWFWWIYSYLCFLFVTVTKFIRIGIADKNDNPPYFDKALYEAEVDENEDIQHTVLTVTAKDHDECKYYNQFYSNSFDFCD